MKFIKLPLWIFSIVCLSTLCILWTSTYWPPKLYWLANLLQMSPLWFLILCIGFLIMMALLARMKVIILVNIISLFVIIFFIMRYNVSFSTVGQKNADGKKHLRVATCNLGTKVDMNSLFNFFSRFQPDIVAFQEAYPNNQKEIEAILSRNKWQMSFQGNLGIASRLKIKDFRIINENIFGGWGSLVIRYELEDNIGSIYLFNTHLKTPKVGIEAIMDKGLGGLTEARWVAELQDKESSIVSKWIIPYKSVLIAGDFNMLETNPIYRKYWSRFINAFSKAGLGFGYTRFTRWHGVRIDHLLCDNSWKVVHSEVGPDIGSDHRPVIADVEFIGVSSNNAQSAEAINQAVLSSKNLIYENFETSFGKFKNYGEAIITIDTNPTYKHGNSLKVEPKIGSGEASIGIQPELWSLYDYPLVNFSYMIPSGVPLEIRVKTMYNDWLYLAGTATNQLINDGRWHEVTLDVKRVVQNVLPGIKSLQELQLVSSRDAGITGIEGSFWIDDFKITKK